MVVGAAQRGERRRFSRFLWRYLACREIRARSQDAGVSRSTGISRSVFCG